MLESARYLTEQTGIAREKRRMATPMHGEEGFVEGEDAEANALAERLYFEHVSKERRVEAFPPLRLSYSRG
jgi:hypothetical protein